MKFCFLLTPFELVMFNEIFINRFLFWSCISKLGNLPKTHTWNVWPRFEPTAQQKLTCVPLWKHELWPCASTIGWIHNIQKWRREYSQRARMLCSTLRCHVLFSGAHLHEHKEKKRKVVETWLIDCWPPTLDMYSE